MTASTAARPRTVRSAPDDDEIDAAAIVPPEVILEIAGITCTVRPMKAKEFFMGMGILTGAFGTGLVKSNIFSKSDDEDDEDDEDNTFAAELSGAFFIALPSQSEQFLALCRALVQPIGTKAERELVLGELENPDVIVLMEIIDAVIENEKDEIQLIMGKARAYLKKWTETFQKAAPQKPKRTRKT